MTPNAGASPTETDAADASIAIPLAAIVRAEGRQGYSVFVVDGMGDERIARVRSVMLGEVRGNTVAVTQGVARGEAVIVTGPGMLVDGERIRVIP